MSEVGLGRAEIDVRASVRALQSDLQRAERITKTGVTRMQRDADRANQRLARMGTGLRQNMDTASRSIGRVNDGLGQSERLARNLIATIGGVAAARAIVGLADEYTELSARIRLVIREGERFADVQNDIFQAAQRSRAPVAELTTLYVRLRQSMADLGHVEGLQMSEILARTLVISGASATEQAGFLRQISQALASGVLRGDEFNSVMENNARFARLLADHLGISVGQLRAMAQEGRITADIIRNAVAGGAAAINDEFSRMPLTIGGAMTQLRNAMARYVGQTDSGLGASRRLADGLSLLARNFESVAEAMLLVGGAYAASLGGRAVQRGLWMAARELRRADAPHRVARFGLQRDRLEAAAAVAADEGDRARRERHIARREMVVRERQARIVAIRQRQAGRMFNADGAEIDRATREGRPPILRPATQAQGPVPIPGAVRGGQAAEAARLERETRRLAASERELQNQRARNFRPASDALVARNRLVWVTQRLAQQNGVLAVSMRAVQAAGVVTTRVFGSLFSFLGGPWGVALTAAIGGWMLFKGAQDRAAQSAARMQEALSIIASATPAFAGAADHIGEVADETRTMADLTERAAEATDDLAEAQRRAASVARDQADATRALAEMRRRDAIATIQQAIAESNRDLIVLRRRNASDQLMRENAHLAPGGNPFASPAENQARRDAMYGPRIERRTADIADLENYLPILERGLEALQSGLIELGGEGGGDGAGGGGMPPGRERLRELRMAAELNLARINLDYERVAALEDQLEIEKRAEQYRKAEMGHAQAVATATREVRAERAAIIAQQQESLRLSGLQEQADLARARDQQRIAEELEDQLETQRRYQQLRADGASEDEATRRAREYVQAQRAAAEAARARAEAEAELNRMLEIADAEGRLIEGERLSRDAEIARRAADYRSRGYGDKSEMAAERDVDEIAAARIRGYAREAFSSALLAAATGGDWREALARSLQQAAERGFSRAIDLIYDMLSDAVRNAFRNAGSSTGGGFLATVFSAFGGGIGAPRGARIPGKAGGGSINPFQLYKGAELGTEPIFLTNKPGQVVTNAQMRAALGSGGGGGRTQIFQIDARGADGTSEARLRLAAAEGAALGEQNALATLSRINRARSSL